MFRKMMLGMYLASMVFLLPSTALAKALPAHAPGRAPHGAPAQASANTVEATETGGGANFVFDPATVSVKTGDTVIFKNTGKVPHTATADDNGAFSTRLDAGGWLVYTYDGRGRPVFSRRVEVPADRSVTMTLVNR